MNQQELLVQTTNRGAIEITQRVNDIVHQSAHSPTLCHVFATHTSVSLMITGNEDPNVLLDIEDYFQRNVADANPSYRHNNEGDFDMSGHIRSILMGESKTIPIQNRQLALGKFQGLFLYEHRVGENSRKLIITLS
ncbi:secondary thiamine-phosphate synthase enzyme YjbQ [uncultured Candidatus Thioglobus sp.]|uniref:secondary thiamine-phosphate synthase enzyme YjbQ n=1 Tax=uncultured Candidatus Thioglobus sp. TaxID=655186 RepID=UPI0032B25465